MLDSIVVVTVVVVLVVVIDDVVVVVASIIMKLNNVQDRSKESSCLYKASRVDKLVTCFLIPSTYILMRYCGICCAILCYTVYFMYCKKWYGVSQHMHY